MTIGSIPAAPARRADRTRRRVRRGPRRLVLVGGLAAVAATVLLAACSSGSAATAAAAANQHGASDATLSTGKISSIGTVLTDQSGLTVYENQQEAGGKIMCTGSCLSFWFPVTVDKGVTPRGVSTITGVIGTIKRPDNGAIQLTVNGHPLYTFRQDNGPGSALGNNFHDSFGGLHFTWHALTTAGVAVSAAANKTPSSSSPASGSPASSSYGY
jgi:predicted lipoprotein with Yx(FWY)xxD motif